MLKDNLKDFFGYNVVNEETRLTRFNILLYHTSVRSEKFFNKKDKFLRGLFFLFKQNLLFYSLIIFIDIKVYRTIVKSENVSYEYTCRKTDR